MGGDREFVHIVGPPGLPLAGWATLGIPLGRFGTDFGLPINHLERPLGSMWSALGPRGAFCSPIEKQPRSEDLASTFVRKTTKRSAFLALEAGATGATGEAEVVSKTVARTPLPMHAGGQDDVSLKQIPQIRQKQKI